MVCKICSAGKSEDPPGAGVPCTPECTPCGVCGPRDCLEEPKKSAPFVVEFFAALIFIFFWMLQFWINVGCCICRILKYLYSADRPVHILAGIIFIVLFGAVTIHSALGNSGPNRCRSMKLRGCNACPVQKQASTPVNEKQRQQQQQKLRLEKQQKEKLQQQKLKQQKLPAKIPRQKGQQDKHEKHKKETKKILQEMQKLQQQHKQQQQNLQQQQKQQQQKLQQQQEKECQRQKQQCPKKQQKECPFKQKQQGMTKKKGKFPTLRIKMKNAKANPYGTKEKKFFLIITDEKKKKVYETYTTFSMPSTEKKPTLVVTTEPIVIEGY